MSEVTLYAVFIHPSALDALGEAIKHYLSDGPYGPHVVCREIDSGGAFFEMTLEGRDADGEQVEVELMIPTGMVRMVISTHSDEAFGFRKVKDNDARPASRRHQQVAQPQPRSEPPTGDATVLPAAATGSAPPAKN